MDTPSTSTTFFPSTSSGPGFPNVNLYHPVETPPSCTPCSKSVKVGSHYIHQEGKEGFPLFGPAFPNAFRFAAAAAPLTMLGEDSPSDPARGSYIKDGRYLVPFVVSSHTPPPKPVGNATGDWPSSPDYSRCYPGHSLPLFPTEPYNSAST